MIIVNFYSAKEIVFDDMSKNFIHT